MKNYPNYVEDYKNLKYSFGDKEKTEPFFWGNIMYNETAIMVDHGDGTISAALQFAPLKVISVRNNVWDVEYKEGADYEVKDNKLIWKDGSSIGYWNEKQLVGEGIPAPYRQVSTLSNILTDYVPWGNAVYTESPFFYGTQVSVTYAYELTELKTMSLPAYQLDSLPNVKAKLEAKSPIKMVTVGDSISEGCSSSFKFNHAPYMHGWVDLFSDALASEYGVEVTSVNQSVGGTTSSYISDSDVRIAELTDEKPDLVFVHYGVNDLGASVTAGTYHDNIERIVMAIQSACPTADIVLSAPMMPNTNIYDTEKMGNYVKRLQKIVTDDADADHGIIVVDMLSLSNSFLKVKRYEDLTANGINHPNDFGHRLYCEAMLATFVDPTKK